MSGFKAALTAMIVSVVIGCGGQRGGAGGGDSGAGGTGTGGAGSGGAADADSEAGNGATDAGGVDAGLDAGNGATDAGGVDAGPDAVPAPVRVIRGDPAFTFDTVTFEARGWPAEDDGRPVILRLGHPDRPPERLVAAEARVERGAFRITVPMGSERGLYKRKILLVDVDGDGACTADVDRVYVDYSFLVADLTFILVGSEPGADLGAGERGMVLGSEATVAEACAVLDLPWPDV